MVQWGLVGSQKVEALRAGGALRQRKPFGLHRHVGRQGAGERLGGAETRRWARVTGRQQALVVSPLPMIVADGRQGLARGSPT